MARWLLLFFLGFLCLIAGILVGSKMALQGHPSPTPPPTPTSFSTPSLPSIPPDPKQQCELVIVLSNDIALGARSTAQMVWVSGIDARMAPLQVTLVPMPESLMSSIATPWLLESGVLNPAVLTTLFGPKASQFHFLVLDLQALTDLLHRIGEVPLAGDEAFCEAEACLDWVYTPGLEPTVYHQRLHTLASGILSWIQAHPQDRALIFHQWLLMNQGGGEIKTDVPIEIWAQWAAQAAQKGLLVTP